MLAIRIANDSDGYGVEVGGGEDSDQPISLTLLNEERHELDYGNVYLDIDAARHLKNALELAIDHATG